MANSTGSNSTQLNYYTAPDNSGFNAATYIKKDSSNKVTDVVIAYRGTEPSITAPQDLITDVNLAFGMPVFSNAQVTDAENYYESVINSLIGNNIDPTTVNISFTGHSLGGGLAQYMGAVTGLQTTTFNAFGMAAYLSSIFTNEGTHPFNIQNYIVDGDFVSNCYDDLGQNHYASIPAIGNDPATASVNEHLLPLNSALRSDGSTASLQQADFSSITPDATATALYNARLNLMYTPAIGIAAILEDIVSELEQAGGIPAAPADASIQKGIGAVALPNFFEGSDRTDVADLLLGTSSNDFLQGDKEV